MSEGAAPAAGGTSTTAASGGTSTTSVSGGLTAAPVPGGIPDATIARLPRYLQVLRDVRGVSVISSHQLAESVGVNPAQLRKDLSYFGSLGTRGVGYDVGRLIALISDHLVGPGARPVLIVGMGKLGTAMAGFTGYPERGFRIAGLIDVAPDRVGARVRVAATIGPTSLVIRHLDDLPDVVAETGAGIALLCVPPRAAQATLERLAAVGVTSVLNFVSEGVHAPEGVRLRDIDLGRELQILAYYQQHPDTTAPPADAAEGQGPSTQKSQKKVSV